MKPVAGVDAAGAARVLRPAGEHGHGHMRVDAAHLADDSLQNGVVAGVAEAVGAADEHAVAHTVAPVALHAEDRVVDLQLAQAGGLLGKVGLAAPVERLAHLAAVIFVERVAREIGREHAHVAGFDEQAGHAVLDDGRHAADVRGDGGQMRARALWQRIGKRLRHGRERVDIERAVEAVEVVDPAEEEHAVLKVQLLCERLELFALLTVARDGEAQLRAGLFGQRHCAQERRDILHGVEPGGNARDDVALMHGIAELREIRRAVGLGHDVGKVEPVVDGKEPVRLKAAVDEPLADGVGHAHAVIELVQSPGIERTVDGAGERPAEIVEPVVAVHGADDRHVYAGPQHGTHDVGHGAVAVHEVILPVADDPFECAEVCQKALAKHHRRDAERGRAVGKITAAEAHELHVDDLTEIFQQGVNMRPGAAGVAPADEVDYFHFALQSTCARRENTV